jgi:hypothetical protein
MAPKKGAAGESFEEKQEKVEDEKLQRQVAYTAIQFGLQIFCAVFVTLAILWGAIQFMRVWQIFGISDLPPGVKFAPELD